MAKEVNYTEDQVLEMKEMYVAESTSETVQEIATKFGKSTRSVIAKLSREGVYVAKQRVTKTGEPVISKAELVAEVEQALDTEMNTLVKASKADLKKLSDIVKEIVYGIQDTEQ